MASRAWRATRGPKPRRAAALVVAFVVLLTLAVIGAGPRPAGDDTPAPPGVPRTEPVSAATASDGPTVALGLPAQGPWDPAAWRRASARVIDRTTLAAEGVVVPDGANVFPARVVDGGPSPAYMLYEAGGGAFDGTVFPASSIKVLAAVGALEQAYAAGFTGDAIVDDAYSLADYYDAAIRYSSNEDYDVLVRIAGVEWLNDEFLPARGYTSTRIQEAYADDDQVAESPAVHLVERGRELVLPERSADEDYGCEASNCSNLFDLVDSVRRVVLAGDIPADEGFEVAPAD